MRRIIIAILLVTGLGTHANAQNWQSLYDSSIVRINDGDIKSATKLLVEALPIVTTAMNTGDSRGYLLVANDLALNYISLGKYFSAKALLQQNLGIGSPVERHFIKGNLALVYINLAKYDTAKLLLNEALQGLRGTLRPDNPEFINVLNNMAIVQYKMGNYRQAERIYKTGIGQLLNAGMGKTTDYANWLNNLALLYTNLARYENALDYFNRARSIYVDIKGEKSVETAIVDNNLGRLHTNMGDLEKAKKLFKKAKKIIRKSHAHYPVILNNLGETYYLGGNWQQADKYFTESIERKETLYGSLHPSIATTLKASARLTASLGDYVSAAATINKAIAIEKKTYGAGHPDLLDSYLQLADLDISIKDYDAAEKFLLKVKEEIKTIFGRKHPQYAMVSERLAIVKMQTNPAEAEEIINESLAIWAAFPETDPQVSLFAHKVKAEILIRKKSYNEALILLNEIIEATRSSFSKAHPSLGDIYKLLATTYIAIKETTLAYAAFTDGLNNYTVQINNYFPFLIDREKVRFYNTLVEFYEQFNAFAILNQDMFPEITTDLYDYQLATKALLLNATSKWKTRIKNSGDLNLIKQFTEWQIKSEQLHELKSLSLKEVQKRGVSLSQLNAELDRIEKELLLRSNHFAKIRGNKRITWQDVQQVLAPREVAVEIIKYRTYDFNLAEFSNDANYFALAVTPGADKPYLIPIPHGDDLEGKWLNQYRNAIRYKRADKFSFDFFWLPLATALADYEKIYLSPDGVYNQINPNSIFNPETGRYVIDEANIQLVTNTRDLLRQSNEDDYNNFALLLGNPDFKVVLPLSADEEEISTVKKVAIEPLPGTGEEIASLEELLLDNDWEVEILSEQEASELNLKSAFKPKLMHIATHGFFAAPKTDKTRRTNPLLNSGLMLAGAENYYGLLSTGLLFDREDGLLTSMEAMSLNIDNTSLVVLSACETGLGEIKNGEGVYGLQRSFIIAGAQSLIMSLWKIDDQATQELMAYFYENWFGGMDKAEAFKEAQISLRQSHPEPYYWGAFVLVGK